ncbi:MAG: hypothetical protein L7T85_06850, partial [Flavobacteriaceae bacterium]|nr:hypothetical protein [Flavobacteriaceae bacterium]
PLEPEGKLIKIEGDWFFKISNVDNMPPFFMSIVSDANHWMFIGSNGGLSAGRKDCNQALFPYYTVDKILETSETTGSKTILRVDQDGKSFLWEPFSVLTDSVYNTETNLYKSEYGNTVIFEQLNHDLGLSFKYQWSSSNRFGFVRRATLSNLTKTKKVVHVLDGIQNLVPYGVEADLQNSKSNLVDAYKKSELEKEYALGIYTLSAIIVDRAEPSEALKATTVWSSGLSNPTYLLSSFQLEAFRRGQSLTEEWENKGEKGAYFLVDTLTLEGNQAKDWHIVADVNQSMVGIRSLAQAMDKGDIIDQVHKDIQKGTNKLIQLCASADGIQLTNDKRTIMRHFSNTMFNIMRGGIFDANYQIEKADFLPYLQQANKVEFEKFEDQLNQWDELFSLEQLTTNISSIPSVPIKRMATEYLPLKFSRRHGDPSRPWNWFSINTQNENDGSKILDYQGNWRDIFQNWEALAHAYPSFIEGMIFRFLNASTFDGYNPYRVTKDGFDWEIIEPHDPWSYIGYWGDHQIIYLLKFLEFIEKHFPGKLADSLAENHFVYAHVPYIIKSYEDIVKNPKDTILFDEELHHQIDQQKEDLGANGALLKTPTGEVYHVNMLEKLLATILAKMSNFVPEAGIWLNTQRPEWNDANNALVGNGTSMVTLYYMRRFFSFFDNLIESTDFASSAISEELYRFFNEIFTQLNKHESLLANPISQQDRQSVVDALGQAGSSYRNQIYNNGFSSKTADISTADLKAFIHVSLSFIDHSIDANKREDGLYHAYNLITFEDQGGVSISYLDEMLEGQVAVLSSGYLSPVQVDEVLNQMRKSKLYREDQNSYILYPNKDLPRFFQKNNVPSEAVESSTLLKTLLADNNKQVIQKDSAGAYHFNGNFTNADSLKHALSELPVRYDNLVATEEEDLLHAFEDLFDHKSFTGRSGTFFGFEGLGSIYWHMVSKLALAVQEVLWESIHKQSDSDVIASLEKHYYEVVDGIGAHKTPKAYGAFPTDPYSHTPAGRGAQQPGMTGQVKEDILCRWGEFGVYAQGGKLFFNPTIVRT